MKHTKQAPTGSERQISSNKVRRRRSLVRSYLWQIISAYTARCSMASWGLPFEAIAASMLLRDKHPRPGGSEEED